MFPKEHKIQLRAKKKNLMEPATTRRKESNLFSSVKNIFIPNIIYWSDTKNSREGKFCPHSWKFIYALNGWIIQNRSRNFELAFEKSLGVN